MNILSWFDKSTLLHLRLQFSFFLMPVFLFALSQSGAIHWQKTIVAFVILHLFLFPASNGYNSYQDRDTTSIGGLKHPPEVTKNLFYATLLMDVTGVLSGMFVSVYFALFALITVLVSRAYSYRKLRLKKYAVIGFLTVCIFQGAFVYMMVSCAVDALSVEKIFAFPRILCMIVASLFIGSIYPLTQIYQHEADKNDGVTSISYKLGFTGTFIFSAILFALATLLLIWYFTLSHQLIASAMFPVLMLPVMLKFLWWFNKVRNNNVHANYENTMSMNLFTSICMNLYFLLLILNIHFTWV